MTTILINPLIGIPIKIEEIKFNDFTSIGLNYINLIAT